ncbi:hypothetical protein DPMN_045854 [Dreissena polymorpha]|uniref:Uncharacterized protein n=1 Tax=Dreissena polymorpha TaxID=45954 RepID=A0A9D4I0B3_DREPO|nr:hypothetical protein DPMN_045854 [Dreissena polymorpha]
MFDAVECDVTDPDYLARRQLEKAVQDLNDHGTLLQKILDTTNDEEWIRSILQRLCHARGKLNLYKGFYGSLEQKLSSNDVYRLHTQRNIDCDVAYYSQQTSAEATYNPETSVARLRLTSEPLQWEGVMIGYETLKWTNSVIENMERDVNRLTKELRYTFSKGTIEIPPRSHFLNSTRYCKN